MSENAQSHTENAVGKQSAQQANQPAKARCGEIILNTALKRRVFIAGLAGAVALAPASNMLGWKG